MLVHWFRCLRRVASVLEELNEGLVGLGKDDFLEAEWRAYGAP